MDCYLVEVPAKKIRFSFSGPTKDAYYAEISPQETYLASSRIFTQEISVWSIKTGKVVKELKGHKTPTCALAFSPDEGRLASLANDGEICVWDLQQQTAILRTSIPRDQFESFHLEEENLLTVNLKSGSQTIEIP